MTERQERITALETEFAELKARIDDLLEEPVTDEKIRGLVEARGVLAALHNQALDLRVRQLRLDIEDQRDRVRDAMGIGAPS